MQGRFLRQRCVNEWNLSIIILSELINPRMISWTLLVGGEMLDFFLTRLNKNAKIVVCGAISDYNEANPRGIKNYLTLISMRATMQGFIVYVSSLCTFLCYSICLIKIKIINIGASSRLLHSLFVPNDLCCSDAL